MWSDEIFLIFKLFSYDEKMFNLLFILLFTVSARE